MMRGDEKQELDHELYICSGIRDRICRRIHIQLYRTWIRSLLARWITWDCAWINSPDTRLSQPDSGPATTAPAATCHQRATDPKRAPVDGEWDALSATVPRP